jgi:hypothetical protein
MRLIYFILFSVFVHGFLIIGLSFSKKLPRLDIKPQSFIVLIESKKVVEPEQLKQLKSIESIIEKKIEKKQIDLIDPEFDKMPVNQDLADILEFNKETEVAELEPINKIYLPTNELDIKAYPVSNIDLSMIDDILRTGMPLKMRIYINMDGYIDKIERLNVNEGDEEFANRLENLLKETRFLSARKNELSVDSYQDVEFSF